MTIWQARLFGTFRVRRGGAGEGDEGFSRFGTRKAGALLAYLAFHADRPHGREALCDLLWPDAPPNTGRARLRVALTSLRRQLEPPGVAPGSVLLSDGREQVQLCAAAVATDVAEVEAALATLAATPGEGAAAAAEDARIAAGRVVVARFTEPLLTGFYEDWVIAERERLARAAVEGLSDLAGRVAPDAGLEFARHAARIDPLAEEPLFALLPLLARGGRHAEARRAFRAFEARCETALGEPPSDALRDLARALPAADAAEANSAADAGPAPAPVPPAPTSAPEPPARRLLLPTYLTRFFGREREREAIRDALAGARCVTLTGPGGAGKTRLAAEAARDWPGPCWFVPLSDVAEADRFPGTLCDALEGGATAGRGAPDAPGALLDRAAAVLTAAGSSSPPLLVLDNLEQIADTVGSALLALLERAPDVRLLVTSRARLHLPGEYEMPVAALPVPPDDDAPGAGEGRGAARLEDVARVPSVALFVDRARAARPDFQITDHNWSDTVAICRLLEGFPLALELVAARAATLVPSRMRSQLAEQGAVLSVADRRGARPGDRHRSLRAAIDWSYRLLSSDLARLFAAVSVFRGGLTAEAAAAVCDAPEAATGEGLARLRAQSLAVSVPAAGEMRYALPESLRAFAAEKLRPKQEDEYRLRHAQWYAGVAEAAGAELAGPGQAAGLERLDAERENLRAALKFSLEADPPLALRLAGALWKYWDLRGRPTEGRAWLDLALRASPAEEEDAEARAHRARALFGAGTMAVTQGDGAAARALLEESLRLYRAAGDDPAAVAGALNSMGLLALGRQAWDEARALLGESLAIRREVGGPEANLAGSLLNLGVVEWERGDAAASLPLFEEALARYRERGDRLGESQTLNNLGGVALALGDFAAAEAWYAQSLVAKREVGYAPGLAATLCNVGVAAMYQGRHDEAAVHFEESLAIYREMDSPDGVADLLRNLGQIATYRAEWGRAFALLDESLARMRASDAPGDIAGILEGYALLAGARGAAAAVPRLLGAAESIRVATDCPLYPSERAAVDRAAAAARSALGDAAYDAALREGAGLSPDAAAALALALPRG